MTKRFRVGGEQVEAIESLNMANVLMLLSRGDGDHHHHQEGGGGGGVGGEEVEHSSTGRVFECRTCNRQFPSFQALGGHRASHKKPRLGGDGPAQSSAGSKPKVHECSVCGLEFAIGQALGGHMRRHRAMTEGFGHENMVQKKSHGRRVVCFDLNLPPLEENGEWLKMGSGIHDNSVDNFRMVDCFH
ncbi:putative transcription factor C2H2 family [Dioscorea sansibarensis]